MKTEQNFYDIIRSKFSEGQTPFDEDNWQSMRKMIDESRADKRRTLWLVLSLSLLLFGGATVAMFEFNNNANRQQHNIVAINNTITNSQTATHVNNQTTNRQAAPVKSDNSQITINEPGNIATTSNSSMSSQSQSRVAGMDSITVKEKNDKRKHAAESGSSMNANNTIASVSSNMNGLPAINERGNLSTAQNIPGSFPVKIAPPSNSISVKSTASLAKVNSHKADSLAAGDALPQRFSEEPRIFQGKTNIFSLELGAEYAFGWEIGSVDQGKGPNYNGGIGYAHYMGSRMFLKTGLLFSTFGNMSPLTYNYQHSVGNVIYDSVITTKRLYFLKVPVQLEYFIGPNKRSSIGVGGELWYLIGNRGVATTYQQLDNNPPMNMITYSKNAPLDGYSKINVSGHLLYRQVLSNKISMYVMFYVEMTNMKNNSFFGENIIERTNGFQYTISYNLN